MSDGGVIDVDAVSRAEVAVKRKHGKYLLKSLTFTQQFSHMYYGRWNRLAPRIRQALVATLGNAARTLGTSRILQLVPGRRAVIIGTLFKNLTSVSSFLREYTKELVKLQEGGDGDDDEGDGDGEDGADGDMDDAGGADAPPASGSIKSIMSETDSIVAEDESGRVDITGVSPASIVTGLVCALVGTLEEKGKFKVERVVYPFSELPPLRSIGAGAAAPEPCYVALVSGLNVASGGEVTAAIELLIDFIAGNLGDDSLTAKAARVARMVVMGNLIDSCDDSRLKSKIRLEPGDHGKPNTDPKAATSANAMRRADTVLRQLAESIDIDVMPGDSDPTNCFMPQQPIHPMLLPSAARQSTLKLVTNPFEAVLRPKATDGAASPDVNCVLTAGQCVADVVRQSELTTLEAMKEMLQWCLMAPTAPNTLACYPFKDQDPFQIDALPHLFASSNHDAFGTEVVTHVDGSSTRLVAVPAFNRTGQVVLVNLNSPTLETSTVTFSLDA